MFKEFQIFSLKITIFNMKFVYNIILCPIDADSATHNPFTWSVDNSQGSCLTIISCILPVKISTY